MVLTAALEGPIVRRERLKKTAVPPPHNREGGHMPKTILTEMGNLIRRIYQEKMGGDPNDLIRVWDEGELIFVSKNDDTQTAIAVGDVIHGREEAIVRALSSFQMLD
jgi:hypothetical protein